MWPWREQRANRFQSRSPAGRDHVVDRGDDPSIDSTSAGSAAGAGGVVSCCRVRAARTRNWHHRKRKRQKHERPMHGVLLWSEGAGLNGYGGPAPEPKVRADAQRSTPRRQARKQRPRPPPFKREQAGGQLSSDEEPINHHGAGGRSKRVRCKRSSRGFRGVLQVRRRKTLGLQRRRWPFHRPITWEP